MKHRQSRLLSSHNEIRDQLSRARGAMRGAVPARAPASKSLKARFTRTRAASRSVPFDRKWVGRQLSDSGKIGLSEFVRDPRFHALDPHPLFSASYYLERNPDVAESGISPFRHYLDHGWREGRDPHPYFANDWYLLQNPDVVQANLNHLCHYLEHGWKEGRRPNPVFDPMEYLNRHPDVKKAGIDPLTHFVMYGLDERRDIPFQGLEAEWRALIPNCDSQSLMDYLLDEDIELLPSTDPIPDVASWQSPVRDFWIPQALRDFMIERGWERLIPLFTQYYSVMDAYDEDTEKFPNSLECTQILERARALSTAMAVNRKNEPEASIIIPVYNNILDTMLCILSLLETHAATDSFEIIVADDCSSDATADLISQIGGVVRHSSPRRESRICGKLQYCDPEMRTGKRFRSF